MNRLLLVLLLFISLPVLSQKKIHCKGIKELTIKASVFLDIKVQNNVIRKPDLLKTDLKLILSDSSYQMIGFIASYDCHSGSESLAFDFTARTFFGNTIKLKDPFIQGIYVGDTLVFECINVRKNGKLFLIPGISFNVID